MVPAWTVPALKMPAANPAFLQKVAILVHFPNIPVTAVELDQRPFPGRSAARTLLWLLVAGVAALASAPSAWAEYRAYELEVVDLYRCTMTDERPCPSAQVRTGMSPELYIRTHGGPSRVGVVLLATWMCYGDTSNFTEICPRPEPHDPRFAAGQAVRILLPKHITEGWTGVVEVAYWEEILQSNVYGVRFVERDNIYARYFEKDLEVAASEADAPSEEPPP